MHSRYVFTCLKDSHTLIHSTDTSFTLSKWLDPFHHFSSIDSVENIFLNSDCPYYDENHQHIRQDRLQFETQIGQYAIIDAELRMFDRFSYLLLLFLTNNYFLDFPPAV